MNTSRYRWRHFKRSSQQVVFIPPPFNSSWFQVRSQKTEIKAAPLISDCFLMMHVHVAAALCCDPVLWRGRDKKLAGGNIGDYAFIIWSKHQHNLLFLTTTHIIRSVGAFYTGAVLLTYVEIWHLWWTDSFHGMVPDYESYLPQLVVLNNTNDQIRL